MSGEKYKDHLKGETTSLCDAHFAEQKDWAESEDPNSGQSKSYASAKKSERVFAFLRTRS